jgi:hypothetical protein
MGSGLIQSEQQQRHRRFHSGGGILMQSETTPTQAKVAAVQPDLVGMTPTEGNDGAAGWSSKVNDGGDQSSKGHRQRDESRRRRADSSSGATN